MSNVGEEKKLSEWSSLDEILEEMDGLVKYCIEKSSRAGYFAAVCRAGTARVKKEIGEGAFEDGPRVERLYLVLASRYLEAFRGHFQKKPASLSWEAAFRNAHAWRPTVFQHLLLGVNAQLHLDLPAAAAAAAPGDALEAMKGDFHRLSEILMRQVEEVQDTLSKIWRAFALVEKTAPKTARTLTRFSLVRARNQAWESANRLAYLNEARREEELRGIDVNAEKLSRKILQPGPAAAAANLFIRLGEQGSVPQIIMTLA
jgi:hypothetical protein